MPGLDLIVRAMRLKDKQVDLIAHNVSNANTSGFREERLAFEERPNPDNSNLTLPLSATTDATVYLNFNQGEIVRTGNMLDVAVEGNGFFEVQSPDGLAYTRNGSFVLDSEGYLVTPSGNRVMGNSGAIRINGHGEVSISRSGNVVQDGVEKGTIKVVDFSDRNRLDSVGNALYKPMSGVTLSDVTSPSVLQHNLEMSNVKILNNMVQLIDASKQFQAYQKILDDQSRLDREAVGGLGRLS